MEIGIRHIDAFHRADDLLTRLERENITRLNGQTAVLHVTDPQFWSLQIAKDGNIVRFFDIDLADVLDDRGFVFVRAVREVEAEDIYAGLYKLQQFVIGVTGRSYGGNDLRFMKSVLKTCFFIHI